MFHVRLLFSAGGSLGSVVLDLQVVDRELCEAQVDEREACFGPRRFALHDAFLDELREMVAYRAPRNTCKRAELKLGQLSVRRESLHDVESGFVAEGRDHRLLVGLQPVRRREESLVAPFAVCDDEAGFLEVLQVVESGVQRNPGSPCYLPKVQAGALHNHLVDLLPVYLDERFAIRYVARHPMSPI